MSNLSAFLKQNAVKQENIKFPASKRFIENGEPVDWELRCLDQEECKKIKSGCTKKVQVPGKKGLFMPETDTDTYLCKVAAACTVFPNLNDSELQDSYGVMGAENLLQKMLLPGEYSNFLEKIQEINGFDITFAEKVDEAKN